MPDTLNTLAPFFLLAAGPGAGWIGSLLFDFLRTRFPAPACPPVSIMQRWAYRAMYAPRYARWSSLLLAALISLSASVLLDLIRGRSFMLALDTALAAALASVFSQVRHSLSLERTYDHSGDDCPPAPDDRGEQSVTQLHR